jgi:hypothetical protein
MRMVVPKLSVLGDAIRPTAPARALRNLDKARSHTSLDAIRAASTADDLAEVEITHFQARQLIPFDLLAECH